MIDHHRFLSFLHRDQPGYGLLSGDGVVDLGKHFAKRWPSLQDVVEANGLAALSAVGHGKAADITVDEIKFTIPLARPEKIICVGVNFPDRNAEYKDGQEAPANMSLLSTDLA